MARTVTRPTLTEVLVRQGILPKQTLDQMLSRLGGVTAALGQTLVSEGILSEEQLARALAAQFDLPCDLLEEFRVDQSFYDSMSVKLMQRHPFDLVVSTSSAILAALERSEGSSQALRELEAEYRSVLVKEDERGEEVLTTDHEGEDQSPAVKLLDSILLSAMQRRASDIHIEAADRATKVKLRVDGILVPAMEPLDIRLHAPLVSRLKVMSDLDIAERRVPQDGSFRMRLERKTVDFRVSILPSVFGESVVIRVLDREAITTGVSALRLERLGFNEEDLKRFRRAITRPYGMVLVTGPTGSGKTTTLYAAITEMNIRDNKLITIEDPVEYQLSGVVQIPVNEKKGLTFARGLRSILRHDPDKIMVGEIRDAE